MSDKPKMPPEAMQVPLQELLRSVPEAQRIVLVTAWSEDGAEIGHRYIPIGRLAHDAANLIDNLKAELDAAKRDAGRLDWLEQHDGRFYNLDRITSIVGLGFNTLPTLRAAIDSAIAQGGSHES